MYLAGSNLKEKNALESYGKNLGLAFQIADDALDYYAKERVLGKEIGKDFFEGKTTLPLIIVFQRAGNHEREFFIKIFKRKKDLCKKNLIKYYHLINKYKAVDESFKRAEYFVNVSRDALAIFDDSHEKEFYKIYQVLV